MLAQLGTYIFQGLEAPRTIAENSGAKYAQIALINGKDVLQKTGDELDELTITLYLSVDFSDPATMRANLKKSMADGEVLPLIMGDGSIVGKFVITGVEVKHERLSPAGVLEAAQINISLLEYSGGEEAKLTGSALAVSNPVAETPAEAVPSVAESINDDISQATNNLSRIKQIAGNAKGNITTFKRQVRDVRSLADNTEQFYRSAKTKLDATQKIINRAGHLPTSLDEAIRYAENLAKMDNVTDFTVINANIDQLSGSAEKVGIDSTPVVAFAATKEGGS